MKVKILTAILAACIAICVVFAAGCGGNDKFEQQVEELRQQVEQLTEEKGELSSQAEDLQQQLADLKEQNALTEEQLSELQSKFEVLIDIDWLSNAGYSWDDINVYIKPEYDNKIYTVEDFSPLEIYILKHSQDNSRYLITLAHYDMKHLVDAVIKLLSFEFVESVELVNMPQGI